MSKSKTVIYHANCDDGFGAAYAAWLYLGDMAEYFAASYGTQPPMELIEDKEVFIVDFSYPLPQMEIIAQVCRKLVVLDHHKAAAAEALSSFREAHKTDNRFFIQFDMERSGAMMTWEFFSIRIMIFGALP